MKRNNQHAVIKKESYPKGFILKKEIFIHEMIFL